MSTCGRHHRAFDQGRERPANLFLEYESSFFKPVLKSLVDLKINESHSVLNQLAMLGVGLSKILLSKLADLHVPVIYTPTKAGNPDAGN